MAEGEIDSETFAIARQFERERRTAMRDTLRRLALEGLHAARDRFIAASETVYASGAGAAARDADRLEALAERLVDFVHGLQPAFEGLELAADIQTPRSMIATRRQARFDPAELAEGLAESLGEALLCSPAQTVLTAAVRRAAL